MMIEKYIKSVLFDWKLLLTKPNPRNAYLFLINDFYWKLNFKTVRCNVQPRPATESNLFQSELPPFRI